ncbi:MAG: hypothetical protein ACLGHP_11435, partial [Vicinamibacteria bacterium]
MATRCAFCHADDGSLVECSGCRTWLHDGCWSDAGACPTIGCKAHARPRRVGARTGADGPSFLLLLTIAFSALIGGCHLADWLNAPTIEVRNDTGAVLTGSADRVPRAPASLTKVLTALAASAAHPHDGTLTI